MSNSYSQKSPFLSYYLDKKSIFSGIILILIVSIFVQIKKFVYYLLNPSSDAIISKASSLAIGSNYDAPCNDLLFIIFYIGLAIFGCAAYFDIKDNWPNVNKKCIVMTFFLTILVFFCYTVQYRDATASSYATNIKWSMTIIESSEPQETVNKLWAQIALMRSEDDYQHIISSLKPMVKKAIVSLTIDKSDIPKDATSTP